MIGWSQRSFDAGPGDVNDVDPALNKRSWEFLSVNFDNDSFCTSTL